MNYSDFTNGLYPLGKSLLCTYLKTVEHEMILSYAKFLNLKMANNL